MQALLLCGDLYFIKYKKRYHRLVTTLGNLGKREKVGFGASRKGEIQKNNVSGCPDELFFVKMNRRGVPKPQNLEKQAFGESRSSKNLKNGSSGCPETRKTIKTAHRRPTKCRNCKKILVVGRRNAKNGEKCLSSVDKM